MTSPFNAPASGDFIDFKDVLGALLLFTVYEETEEHTTVHGPNTAVIADVVVLDGEQAGRTYDNAYIYPRALKPQLRKSIGGKMVLGRLGQGSKKAGQNPAWTLTAATPEDEALAMDFINANGTPAEVKAEREAEQAKPW